MQTSSVYCWSFFVLRAPLKADPQKKSGET
jgi:hypothetical protein